MSNTPSGSEHDGLSVSQRQLIRQDETRRSEGEWGIHGGLSELMLSNVMRDEGCDDAIGVLGNTGARYQNTIIRSQHFNAPRSTFNNVEGTQNNIVNVNVNNTVVDKGKHDKILQWLYPTIPSANYDQALKACHSNTGQWLIEDKRFLEWKSNSSSLLWLHGKPGCGKTVLSSVVIQNISDYCDSTAEKAYAYFFFDGRDSQTGLQRHERLVRSLIWQFSEQAQRMPEALEALYDQCSSGIRQSSVESLQRTLLLVLRQFHHAYLIIDALDECTDRRELLHWINEIMGSNDGRLHVLATSRQDVDIKIGLMELGPVSISLEGDSVNTDIATYLDSMLRPDPRRNTWRNHADTCNTVKTSLMKGAEGMFRWVALQLDVLHGCRNRQQVKEQLARLPKDLNETYDRILTRIQESDREDAVKLFQWLAFSVRPLTLPELAEVVQIDFNSPDLPWFNSERQYDDLEDILRVCSGFVSMTDGGEVKLAHLSVKEYLLACGLPQFRISEATSHSLISKTCLAYLAQFNEHRYWDADDYWIADRLRLHPLAKYAAEHWVSHGLCSDVDTEVKHRQLALNVFQRKHIFRNWTEMRDWPWLGSTDCDPISCASEAGLDNVVRVLLDDSTDINEQVMSYDSALRAASSKGHEAIVKMLLEHGADVHAQGGWDGSALHRASSNGHEAVVKILLDHGADVNAQGGLDGSALQEASSNGHEAVVKILLNHDADVNAQGGPVGSALQRASLNSHEAVVKILLEHGADVNAQGGLGGSSLHRASSNGHEEVVKILFEHGADVNAQGGRGGSALHRASSHGHAAVVKILLEHGADVNAQGGDYGSSLQQASSKGHEAVVKILLDHGADVNAQGGLDGSALQEASSNGHEAVVKILLEHGADVYAQGGLNGSALQRALSNGHEAVVKILLEHGADVNPRGEDGSALQ